MQSLSAILPRLVCARYTMSTSPDELIEEFEASTLPDEGIDTRFNIAPTDSVPIVTASKGGERRIHNARFGMVPHWAKGPKIGVRFLNARSESLMDKPVFRSRFTRYRCLVAADGFYEWRRRGKQKVPLHFRLPEGGPFGMAGLWAVWGRNDEEKLVSFTIITRVSVASVQRIHERMPVLIPRSDYGRWLHRDNDDPAELQSILEGHRGAELIGREVSVRVNSVKYDDPSCVEPIG